MKKIDTSIVPSESGGTYPRPFDERPLARSGPDLLVFNHLRPRVIDEYEFAQGSHTFSKNARRG